MCQAHVASSKRRRSGSLDTGLASTRAPPLGADRLRWPVRRNTEPDRRPAGSIVLRHHASAVGLDNAASDREPYAHAAAFALRGVERLEDLREAARREYRSQCPRPLIVRRRRSARWTRALADALAATGRRRPWRSSEGSTAPAGDERGPRESNPRHGPAPSRLRSRVIVDRSRWFAEPAEKDGYQPSWKGA